MDDQNLARQAELSLQQHGDYDTLFFEGRWHSTGQLADRASRFATGLAALGLRPGDRLVVLMANCPEVQITYTATWRAGAVVTPLIFLVSEDELRNALADSDAKGVVTTAEFLPKVLAATATATNAATATATNAAANAAAKSETDGAPGVEFIVCVDAPPDAPAIVRDFAAVAAAEPGEIVPRAGSDLAALLYTGGTTGRSKGVPLTHENLNWCGRAVEESSATSGLDRHLIPLPFAHAYGLLVLCVGIHRSRPGQTILMRWFDPAGWLSLAAEHQVQASALVPSMLAMLLTQPLEDYDLSSLSVVASGAAPLPDDVREQFEKRVPGVTVYEGYGCTESATIISANPLGARRIGSVGIPVPGCEVSIRDDHDQPVPAGTDGEICARSAGVMSGYWHAPELSETVLAGGWLHTGDIGHLDEDGYLYVVDRKKDLILRGGFNVYPRDIEDVLVSHPAVSQAGVVGRPDPRLGEEIVAFVSLSPGAEVTPEELVEYGREHLSRAKYPREVRVVPDIPLTSVLKLDRKKLREWARDS